MDSVPDELVPASARPGDLLYGLDSNLQVSCANDAWRAFASENGGEALLSPEWHGNALAGFSGSEKLRWQGIYSALLAGRLESHEEKLICPSPAERRDYSLRITARRDPSGRLTCLLHHMVWQDSSTVAKAQGSGGAHRTAAPSQLVRPPSFRAAQCLAPLDEVGGDLLWHWERPDGTTDVVLADAIGHGEAAARIADRITHLLDELAPMSGGVAAKVSALNRGLLERQSRGPEATAEFATGLYLRLHPRESRIEVCSFAHEGPIFSDVGLVTIPTGLPVGIVSETEPWPEVSLDLEELGRRVLLCSDGVSEQFDEQGDMFGVHRLERYFLLGRELPVAELVPALMAHLEVFRGSALIKDDRTMLVVELAL
jgi:Stage II sporulation protein E (SpoIIE)